MLQIFKDNYWLLKGIAENTLEIRRIQGMKIYVLKDQNRIVPLKRVHKALLHDAAKITVSLPPQPRKVFKAAVEMAIAVSTPDELTQFMNWLEAKVIAGTDKEWKQLELLGGTGDGQQD